MSVEDLLHHIRKQAGDDNDDDGKPGRAAGQQLHEDKVHVLCVEEGPGGDKRNKMLTDYQRVQLTTTKTKTVGILLAWLHFNDVIINN